jgi:hypothetical protein
MQAHPHTQELVSGVRRRLMEVFHMIKSVTFLIVPVMTEGKPFLSRVRRKYQKIRIQKEEHFWTLFVVAQGVF